MSFFLFLASKVSGLLFQENMINSMAGREEIRKFTVKTPNSNKSELISRPKTKNIP